MKKALSLLLALVLCLSLCACNNTDDISSTQDNDSEATVTSEATITNEDPFSFLYNELWTCVGGVGGGAFFLYKDGTGGCMSSGKELEWTLDGNLLTISPTYGLLEIIQANDTYYLIGDFGTFLRSGDIENVPKTTVTLTIDNWKDYLEVIASTVEVKDQFGEPTGEAFTQTVLQIKDLRRYVSCGSDSQNFILIRYSALGMEHDVSISDSQARTLLVEGLTIDQMEMLRIEGEITYLDGI